VRKLHTTKGDAGELDLVLPPKKKRKKNELVKSTPSPHGVLWRKNQDKSNTYLEGAERKDRNSKKKNP
jgi:hypothetical protein